MGNRLRRKQNGNMVQLDKVLEEKRREKKTKNKKLSEERGGKEGTMRGELRNIRTGQDEQIRMEEHKGRKT